MNMVGNSVEPQYYQLSGNQALEHLQSSIQGLSCPEADRRLKLYGLNSLQIAKKEPRIIGFLRQFKDLMIVLLLVSAGLSWYLGDSRTSVVLLALVLFNTVIGFAQEYKAEKLIESLEKLVVAKARVLRNGAYIELASAELVRGDIVRVEAGDSVPADLRILEEDELSTNDFALTGESNPSRKFKHALAANLVLPQRQNMVHMGTTVATGEGTGVVTATGMNTELGRIANLSQNTTATLSPLQREMNHIASRVTIGTFVLCVLLLPIAVYGGLAIKEAFLFAIGIASSIIPQGLPAEINTALAQAASKLARARALVKKLSAVETLGATNVILTDKTGTLTKNEMTVEYVLIGKREYMVSGSGYEANGIIMTPDKKAVPAETLHTMALFFKTGVLASNALVNGPDAEHASWHVVGDPTEGALITLARKAGINTNTLQSAYPERKEYAFDSARKRMSSVREVDGKLYLFVKGAPESILAACTMYRDGTRNLMLTAKARAFFVAYNEQHAALAQRNLAYAYRALPRGFDPTRDHLEAAEQKLTLLGMVSMIDPLRDEVPAAMDAARQAHMRVSIVTGDFAVTARAIAVRARLADAPEAMSVVSGDELPSLTDQQILSRVRQGGAIFSRVSPEDKMRIVGLTEAAGMVVAVTGDGINDAPALKRADIGVAMGVTGTDVAKQSAEIILLDDSFHTLVGAVRQGRTIFKNIQKGTLSCFTSNFAELIVNLVSLAAATAFGIPLALSIMQILAIDLIAELFPIAALGRDKAEGDLMRQPPRDLHDHILNRRSVLDLLWCGILIGVLAFLNYLLFYWRRGIGASHITSGSLIHYQAASLTYLTIVLCQLVNILQRRSEQGLFSRYQLHNRTLWGAIGLSLVCVSLILYSPLNTYFASGPLSLTDWLCALAAVTVFGIIREFELFTHRHSRAALFSRHHPSHIRRNIRPL